MSDERDLHGVPTATELVQAVREFLERDVMDATEGRVRFHARVAAKVLGMVERELNLTVDQQVARTGRLSALGVADEAELAAGIRAGAFDDTMRDVFESVRADVAARLEVANPTYAGPSTGA